MKKKYTNHILKKAITLTTTTAILCTGILTTDLFRTQSVTAKTTSQKAITVTDYSTTTTDTTITQSIAKTANTNTKTTTAKTVDVTAKPTTINTQDTMPTADTTPTPAKGAAKKRIIARMNSYCKPFNLRFNNNGVVKR